MPSSSTHGQAFVMDVLDLDDVSIARDGEGGDLVAERPLADDAVSFEDVVELAYDHGLTVVSIEVDTPAGVVRVALTDADANFGEGDGQ